MKKIYLLAFTLGAFAFSTSAQVLIDDDMEAYGEGPIHYAHWSGWSDAPGDEDLEIVSTYAHSGSQSGMVGGNGLQDPILKLGNKTTGQYTLSWYMYIPASKGAYYNFQENEIPGNGAWGLNVYFNPGGANIGVGAIFDDSNPAVQVSDPFNFPEDTWFKITHEIDVDADTVTVYLDGLAIYSGGFYTGSNLGGVDYFSIDANNEMYIDDVMFATGFLGVDSFTSSNFSVYPNPVNDILNIATKTAVDQIAVYDILGKMVLNTQPNAISPKIDMSSLSSGIYMVKVTIGNNSKTVKVIK